MIKSELSLEEIFDFADIGGQAVDIGLVKMEEEEEKPFVENIPAKCNNNQCENSLRNESTMKSLTDEGGLSQLTISKPDNPQMNLSGASLLAPIRVPSTSTGSFDPFGKSIPLARNEEVATDAIKDVILLEFNTNIVDFENMAREFKPRVPNEDDWNMLLRQNKKLLINMIFGLYLTAKDAETQIQWLKAESTVCACHMKICKFQDASIFLRDTLKLFNGDVAMQNAYLGFSQSLQARFPVTPPSRKFLLELLFFYFGKLPLNDPRIPLQECMQPLLQIPLAKEKSHQWLVQTISEIGETLEAMAVLFQHSGLASHKLSDYPVKPVNPEGSNTAMGFTMEEDLWLSYKKDEALYNMEKVEMGHEFAEEVLNFNFNGTPVSPNFSVRATYGFQERLWRFFTLHSEFQELSRANQAHLVENTINVFWALMTSRLSGVQVPEQVKFTLSDHEINKDLALKQVVYSQLSPEESSGLVRSIRIENIFPGVPAKVMEKYVEELQPLVRREDDNITFFALLVLSVCGSSIPNDSVWRGMRSLAKQYELIVARKFSARREAAKIHRAVSSLHIMANMLPVPFTTTYR